MSNPSLTSHACDAGTSSTALGVLAHVTAEYMTNLGRTLRFYSERYGDRMSSEVRSSDSSLQAQAVSHALLHSKYYSTPLERTVSQLLGFSTSMSAKTSTHMACNLRSYD